MTSVEATPLLFVSKTCRYSALAARYAHGSGLVDGGAVRVVCIDDQWESLPGFIRKVPTLYFPAKDIAFTGAKLQEALSFMTAEQKRARDETASLAAENERLLRERSAPHSSSAPPGRQLTRSAYPEGGGAPGGPVPGGRADDGLPGADVHDNTYFSSLDDDGGCAVGAGAPGPASIDGASSQQGERADEDTGFPRQNSAAAGDPQTDAILSRMIEARNSDLEQIYHKNPPPHGAQTAARHGGSAPSRFLPSHLPKPNHLDPSAQSMPYTNGRPNPGSEAGSRTTMDQPQHPLGAGVGGYAQDAFGGGGGANAFGEAAAADDAAGLWNVSTAVDKGGKLSASFEAMRSQRGL